MTGNTKTALLRNLILPLGDFLFGQRMMSRLKFLEEAQHWPVDQIIEKQNQLLREVIKVSALEVPFYRKLFAERGISPSDIQSADDLSKIPVVTKEMLREVYPQMATRSTGQKTYETSTSGSTGKNFFVIEDAYTAGWYRSTFLLQLEWSGWRIGIPHLQTGMTLNRSLDRRLKDWMLGCHYFSAYNLDDIHLDQILDAMDHHKLKHLWGYPGSLYFLAKRAKELGWNKPLISVVTWGDTLFSNYRKVIEETFHTKVFDTYGCGEGVQIAAQCEFGNYHLHAFDAVIEFLDDNEQPVEAGKIGNIIVTRLHPGPMPLIRYAIGDLGVPSLAEKCSCGRTLPIMDSIKGRSADVITTPSGNRLIVHFFTGILEHYSEIEQFQIVQSEPGVIVIYLVPKSEITPELKEQITEILKRRGAGDLKIFMEIVDRIYIGETGKHRFIINNLDHKQ